MQDFFKGELIKGTYAETFENMSDEYSKDCKNVYYDRKIIKNADIENFIIMVMDMQKIGNIFIIMEK